MSCQSPVLGPLRGYVEEIEVGHERLPASVEEDLLPDGGIDLLFDLGDAKAAWVIASAQTPSRVTLNGHLDTLRVRLRPGAVRAVLEVSARELRGTTVALSEIWGREAEVLLERLAETEASLRPELFQDALSDRLAGSSAIPDRRARDAVARIVASGGALSSRDVADGLGLGARRLEQLFAEHVGLSPKQLGRLARFRRTVDYVLDYPTRTWRVVAQDCGYADQAHLIREFVTLGGASPNAPAMKLKPREGDFPSFRDLEGPPPDS